MINDNKVSKLKMSSLIEIKNELDMLSSTGSEDVYDMLRNEGANMSKNLNGIFFDLAKLDNVIIDNIRSIIDDDKRKRADIQNEKTETLEKINDQEKEKHTKKSTMIPPKCASSSIPKHIKDKIISFGNSICSRATMDAVLENSNKYSLCVKKFQKPSHYSDEIHTEILQKEY